MASQPGPAMELLGRVAYELQIMKPLLPTYLHLLVSAIFPIYTAAHASLSRPLSAAPKKKGKNKGVNDQDDDDESDEEISQKIESLTPSDALLFPLLAGATLASLYFILKWLQDPAWLNWALGLYFSQMGLFFAMKFLKDVFSVLRSYTFPTEYSAGGSRWKVDLKRTVYISDRGTISKSPLPGILRHVPLPTSISRFIWTLQNLLYTKARLNFHLHQLITLKTSVDLLDLSSLVLSCAIVYYHTFIAKPWFLTNFLGFSFCYGSLQFMTPSTAWTGTLVLGALFFYDIYFVFFTPMMVTVATKLDVPIKLLFPRPDGCIYPVGVPEGSTAMEEYLQCLAKKRSMAMLGLGDIVVPGMMLAFALRFDLYVHYLKKSGRSKPSQSKTVVVDEDKPAYINAHGQWGERFWTNSKSRSEGVLATKFPKPYFYASIFGYIIGMITTVVVMQIAAHAQPALLYLVPGVLISLWSTALVKGEFQLLWNYSELPEDDDKKGLKSGDEKEKKDKLAITNTKADTNTVAEKNSDSEKEKEGIKSDQGIQDKTSVRLIDQEKKCRRLIYFAITLPKSRPSSGGETATELAAIADAEANADDTITVGAAESKSNSPVTPPNESLAISTGRVTRSQDRTASGEPLGKRARRV
ncbi:hypothetical protein LTR84_001228 [Exophiala bonariae]|uniref:Signal peptide peptidase n=1 Tax=Exophiala bonariae TaxID=1690606 RepID=A0AAV9NVF4_9EURO|nr:hypothetical protein LTR84_001228 [Exophiala bonariae]